MQSRAAHPHLASLAYPESLSFRDAQHLSFTIYRWDINVRMSTIIGFGGGGGIGFLVQQNLNHLKYRDASVQMIAIAIVVATLDFVSAKVRERIL